MATLHAVDYIIFILSIVFSFLIGVYYSCRKTTNTTEAYLLANRKLSIIPISISLLVSFFSAISMLGNSSEMYYYGAEYMLTVIGWDIGAFMATLTYVPLMQPLKLVSVHEVRMMIFLFVNAINRNKCYTSAQHDFNMIYNRCFMFCYPPFCMKNYQNKCTFEERIQNVLSFI